MKALIVDDEVNVRRIIRFMGQWQKHGITDVLEARNGEEAKELIDREKPEIIMTDVKMPRKNGIQLLEWLDENEYPGEVIMISGFDDYAFMRKAILHGSFDYLLKPIEGELLNKSLAGAIRSWKEKEQERRNADPGLQQEMRRYQASRDLTGACHGECFDRDAIAASLPEADAYDLTLIYFYQTHDSYSYVERLSEELTASGLGNAFILQNDSQVGVMLSASGQFPVIEEWMSRHIDTPVRMAEGTPLQSLDMLRESYLSAQKAMAEQNFRSVQRLTDLDESRRMQDMVAYVDAHYSEDISLDRLSSHFFLSREHISRRFKQETGLTLSTYVIRLRIDKAMRLLAETEEKIYDIALKIGYQDETYFSKLFKKQAGMTPVEYRKDIKHTERRTG